MATAVLTAPQGGQYRYFEIAMQGWDICRMAVEQFPGSYRLWEVH